MPSAFAQEITNFQLTGEFGGRFLNAGVNPDETIAYVVSFAGVTYYDLRAYNLPIIAELNFDSIHPPLLRNILKYLNYSLSHQPPERIISSSERYQLIYQEYGLGTLFLLDGMQPTATPRMIHAPFLGLVNSIDAINENIQINFSIGGLHCSIDVSLQYLNQSFVFNSIDQLPCEHGYMYESPYNIFAAQPTSESFNGRFDDASPHSLVLVRLDDMGLVSENPEDQLLISGHSARIVHQEILSSTHYLTVSGDQTARLWTLRNSDGALELDFVQVIDLEFDPEFPVQVTPNKHLLLADTQANLHIFELKVESPFFGQRLQTLAIPGGEIRFLAGTYNHIFYTLTADNILRRWEDIP